MRLVLVLVAMIASGIGFARLVSGKGGDEKVAVESVENVREGIPAKVRLVFSGITGFWELKSGDVVVELKRNSDGVVVGETVIDPENPVMFLKVSCIPPPVDGTVRFFAKLVVEAEGEETFIHVFDAPGDIDDFVELPF